MAESNLIFFSESYFTPAPAAILRNDTEHQTWFAFIHRGSDERISITERVSILRSCFLFVSLSPFILATSRPRKMRAFRATTGAAVDAFSWSSRRCPSDDNQTRPRRAERAGKGSVRIASRVDRVEKVVGVERNERLR